MKKILTLCALAAFSTVSFAVETVAASETGGVGNVTGGTGGNCTMLPEGATATLRFSKGVAGAWACSTTAAGVGAHHPQGKQFTFSASSAGGAVTKAAGTSAADAATAALTAAAGSS